MKKRLIALLCLVGMLTCVCAGALAEKKVTDRFCDTWAGKHVTVEIREKKGELQCRAVFKRSKDEVELWEYGCCWYDKKEKALWCGGVTRTWLRRDDSGEMAETDWSMADLDFASFVFTDDGESLIWKGDGLDAPIELMKTE